MGKFVAIRMIVVNPDKDKEAFKGWMTGTFLGAMGSAFQDDGLEKIILLEGNKVGARQSYEGPGNPDRRDSTAAGANADFAWITFWTSRSDNQRAWGNNPVRPRPEGWNNMWRQFLDWCHPRLLIWEDDTTPRWPPRRPPRRPLHGPPYDYSGAPTEYYGRGAGCLVEGFELIDEWVKPKPQKQ